ncbi:hypothetical protein SFRURICE_003514 [Spodoptera frugiperda]|nr:hypothetical protein SFRURICE_003514 [Spodoptera frugiperda]
MRPQDTKEGKGVLRLSRLKPQPQASLLHQQGREQRQQQRGEKHAAALHLAPKTAAVVITLQPDTVQRGVTYGNALAKLKGAVTAADFGTLDGFSMKVTATGACLLEVPGVASGSSADALGERIRAFLARTRLACPGPPSA